MNHRDRGAPRLPRGVIVGVALLVLAGSVVTDAGGRVDAHLLQALRLTPVTSTPPPLALKRVEDGRTVTLADLRGRPVLLYFWATW